MEPSPIPCSGNLVMRIIPACTAESKICHPLPPFAVHQRDHLPSPIIRHYTCHVPPANIARNNYLNRPTPSRNSVMRIIPACSAESRICPSPQFSDEGNSCLLWWEQDLPPRVSAARQRDLPSSHIGHCLISSFPAHIARNNYLTPLLTCFLLSLCQSFEECKSPVCRCFARVQERGGGYSVSNTYKSRNVGAKVLKRLRMATYTI